MKKYGLMFSITVILVYVITRFSTIILAYDNHPPLSQDGLTQLTVSEDAVFLKKPDSQSLSSSENMGIVESETTPFFWFIRSFLILFVLLACLFLILKWIQRRKTMRFQTSPDKDQIIRSLTKVPLGSQHYLEVIQIIDKVYILGISPQQISLIRLIEDQQELSQLCTLLTKEQNKFSKLKHSSFKQFLASQIDQVEKRFFHQKN